MSETVQVPAPKFEMHEFVTLHWNSMKYPTRIVQCWFRLSSQEWWYQIAQVSNELDTDRLFPDAVLESRLPTYEAASR